MIHPFDKFNISVTTNNNPNPEHRIKSRSILPLPLFLEILTIKTVPTDPQHKTVRSRTATVDLALLLNRQQLRLVLQTDPLLRVELHLVVQLYQGSEFRSFVLQIQLLVFVQQRAVVPAHADLLHHHVGVAVSADRYLVITQPD